MKVFGVICAAFLTLGSALNHPEIERINELRNACVAASGVDIEQIQNLRQGIFNDEDPLLKEYTLCMFKKMGIHKEDGAMDIDKLKEILSGDKEHVEELLKKCLILKSTAAESAYESYKCVYKHSPHNIPK